MDKDALIRRLMKTFLVELQEHVSALERDLLLLERNPSDERRVELFGNLFRTGHSLKGAARSVNIEVLESAGHLLESIFSAAQDGHVALDASLFDILLGATDAIKDTGRRLEAGEDISKGPLATLLPKLRNAYSGPSAAGTPKSATTARPPKEGAVAPSAAKMPETADASTERDGFVRLSSARLDRLIAYGSELWVARGRSGLRDTDLDRLLAFCKQWRSELHTAQRSHRASLTLTSQADMPSERPERRMADPFALGDERLRRLIQQLTQLSSDLKADRKAIDQIAGALEDELIKARMVPFSVACEGFDRTVRDLAKKLGKEIELTIEGGEIEIDRSIALGIKDALLHLVRNAVDHGLESPVERRASGKTARGRILLSAALQRGRVQIVVADDGRGFDPEAIRAEVRRRGMEPPEDERALIRLAFTRALSTSPTVTEVSGRGIGLDIVKAAIESHRGSYDVSFEPGKGSRITLSVPLTLTKIPALLVRAGGQTYALDSAAVHSLMRVGDDDLRRVEDRDVLTLNGAPLSVFRLLDALGMPGHEGSGIEGKRPIVVVQEGGSRVALAVDELIAAQVLVVKDLTPALRGRSLISGATILPTGHVALILSVPDLIQVTAEKALPGMISDTSDKESARRKVRLLIVDDSITTRTLVRNILESSGYEVSDAADGMEAWQHLQEYGADLVVSDVEMPRMDGFALTEAIRNSRRFRELPVILVTALETEADKMRGLEAGASAYLLKSGFDQTNLIETIEQLV